MIKENKYILTEMVYAGRERERETEKKTLRKTTKRKKAHEITNKKRQREREKKLNKFFFVFCFLAASAFEVSSISQRPGSGRYRPAASFLAIIYHENSRIGSCSETAESAQTADGRS